MKKYTRELLEPLIKESSTWAEVCRRIGIKPFTGAQTHLKKIALSLGLDVAHFKGQAWSRGEKRGFKKPLSYYLTINSTIKSDNLKKRLIKEGVKDFKCEKCERTKWFEQPIPLELHHINCDHWDNRLENLMILCPNCHSQE